VVDWYIFHDVSYKMKIRQALWWCQGITILNYLHGFWRNTEVEREERWKGRLAGGKWYTLNFDVPQLRSTTFKYRQIGIETMSIVHVCLDNDFEWLQKWRV
jgi:hypothetical protein